MQHTPRQSAAVSVLRALADEIAHPLSLCCLCVVSLYVDALTAMQIVRHVNKGISSFPSSRAPPVDAPNSACWFAFFTQPDIVPRVVELELIAGKQAKSATAYNSSISVFNAALQILQRDARRQEWIDSSAHLNSADETTLPVATTVPPPDDDFLRLDQSCWKRSHTFCVQLYRQLADCFYLLGPLSLTQRCIEYALQHITELADRSVLRARKQKVHCAPRQISVARAHTMCLLSVLLRVISLQFNVLRPSCSRTHKCRYVRRGRRCRTGVSARTERGVRMRDDSGAACMVYGRAGRGCGG